MTSTHRKRIQSSAVASAMADTKIEEFDLANREETGKTQGPSRTGVTVVECPKVGPMPDMALIKGKIGDLRTGRRTPPLRNR